MKIYSHLFGSIAVLLALAAPAFAQDAVDLSTCVQTPGGVDQWARTATITHLEVGPTGFHIDFDKRESWPDVTPPGWDGPIRWTVWLGSTVNGRCHLAASLNVWNRDDSYGGPVDKGEQWSKNLYYLDSALKDHTPAEGETVYLMVTAGAERGLSAFKVAERSQIIAFPLVVGSWSYTKPLPPAPPVVQPPAVIPPTVSPAPTPQPLPSTDLSPVLNAMAVLEAKVDAVGKDVHELRVEVESAWKQYVAPLVKYGLAIAAGFLAKAKL